VVKSNPAHLPLVGSGDNNYATITLVSRLVSKTTCLNEITRGECGQRVQGYSQTHGNRAEDCPVFMRGTRLAARYGKPGTTTDTSDAGVSCRAREAGTAVAASPSKRNLSKTHQHHERVALIDAVDYKTSRHL
jgi:hypothetical protein